MESRGAAATWDQEPIDRETWNMLYDLLEYHPDYTVRPVIQTKHDNSAIVKTIETLSNAEETKSELVYRVMSEEEPFDEIDEELEEVMDRWDLTRSDLLTE